MKKLHLKNIQFNPHLSFSAEQKKIFEDVITWKTPPPIVKTGRSSFLLIDDEKIPFKGIKIKGCGYFDVEKNMRIMPADKESYVAHVQQASDGITEIHYQIEVNDNDELIFTRPKDRPFGGQNALQAKHEYEVNKLLHEKLENPPFYNAIGYAEYKDAEYEGKSLGVTILGIQPVYETPLSPFFQAQFEEKGLRINPYLLKYWELHNSAAGSKSPDYFQLIGSLQKLSNGFGKGISLLHNHFVDYDAHLFNATVNLENGQVILYDFDHVLDIQEISDQKYFYYALKDLQIGYIALLSNFLLSGIVDGIVLFEELDEAVDKYNIIDAYFAGYFGKLDNTLANQVKDAWRRVIMFSMNILLPAKPEQKIHLVHDFCETEREKMYFDLYLPLFNKITQFQKHLSLSKEKHDTIIQNLLKQKKDLAKLHTAL